MTEPTRAAGKTRILPKPEQLSPRKAGGTVRLAPWREDKTPAPVASGVVRKAAPAARIPSGVRVLAVIGVVVVGLVAVSVLGAVFWPKRAATMEANQVQRLSLAALRPPPAPRLATEPLDATLRAKGFHECNPHDAVGFGPYAPGRSLTTGRLLIPKQGGHTQSHGYDVLVHFHGQRAARIFLAQTALGVALAGIDAGDGSGPYERAFENPSAFPALLASIEAQLKKTSGDERAHIRHVGLTAWSAGYGAIREILKQNGDKRIDAIVLLDGLHASWNPGARRRGGIASANARGVKPIFDFAKKALRGEKTFILTHSQIDPVRYPSTSLTADLLLHELRLERHEVLDTGGPYAQTAAVDQKGFHLWSYRGRNELAHCDHLRHISQAVRDVLEVVWRTPPMQRDHGTVEQPGDKN